MIERMAIDPPTYDSVLEAARRLAGHAVRTPLLESQLLNDRVGRRLLIKAECLQRTGSFKFRGAFNKLVQIPPERRGNGVVAHWRSATDLTANRVGLILCNDFETAARMIATEPASVSALTDGLLNTHADTRHST